VSWFRRKQESSIPRIEVVDIRPGDTLVFSFPNRVPRDVFERIKAQYKNAGVAAKIIVLESGAAISVIREKEDTP
jgi:hypothetical protein